jgi:hypothetical protein
VHAIRFSFRVVVVCMVRAFLLLSGLVVVVATGNHFAAPVPVLMPNAFLNRAHQEYACAAGEPPATTPTIAATLTATTGNHARRRKIAACQDHWRRRVYGRLTACVLSWSQVKENTAAGAG